MSLSRSIFTSRSRPLKPVIRKRKKAEIKEMQVEKMNSLSFSPSSLALSFSTNRRRGPPTSSISYGAHKDIETTHHENNTPTVPPRHIALEPTKPTFTHHKVQIPPNSIGVVAALGKFDALHLGHRELAIQASKVGFPYLLSFVGMAEVLGWEPRAPIVAKCDRKRVLSTWSPYCGNVVPVEYEIEFSTVRHLSPRQFVEKLSKELGVSGVVAGENYRFGYKAAGDAFELVRLCEEYGMEAYVIKPVMDRNQDPRNMTSNDLKERGQVSSTRVRHALALGDMKYVAELLGRNHRLVLRLKDLEQFSMIGGKLNLSAQKSYLLNLPPKEGTYDNCALLLGDNHNPQSCRVVIDATNIYLEAEELGGYDFNNYRDLQLVAVEFGDY